MGGDSIGSGAYSVPSNYSDVLARRADQIVQNDPDIQIAQGISHLNDPSLAMDFQTRMHLAEPLLRAQHFGAGGGLQNGSGLLYPTAGQQSQGQIKPGKAGGGDSKAQGLAGMIGSIAALL